jgi:regulator of cell morphogenesis and NO signaling
MKTADLHFIGKSIPGMSNVQVMSYLITTHHEFTRNIMAEIDELIHQAELELDDRLSQKGGYAPVLARLAYKLKQLNQDLQEHMEIESSLLFPRILGKTR